MYVGAGIDVEESCYDYGHIKNVLKEIKKNFEEYFQRFHETKAGSGLTDDDFANLQKKFGIDKKYTKPTPSNHLSTNYKSIIKESFFKYEKDQDA